jgi:hypothetical protein
MAAVRTYEVILELLSGSLNVPTSVKIISFAFEEWRTCLVDEKNARFVDNERVTGAKHVTFVINVDLKNKCILDMEHSVCVSSN